MLERCAIEVLHHDERQVAVCSYLVNRADVRGVQRRRCTGFTPETPLRAIRKSTPDNRNKLGVLATGTGSPRTLVVDIGGSLTTLLALRTKTEERYLIERFGNQYCDYMTRVGRFLPKVGEPVTPPATGRSIVKSEKC